MAPAPRQWAGTDLDNFGYLLQQVPGNPPVEYVPVDDFFDQYLEALDFADVGFSAAGMAKGARIEPAELPDLPDMPDLADTATDSATMYGGSPQTSIGTPPHSDGSSMVATSVQQLAPLSSGTMSRSGSEASASLSPPPPQSQPQPQPQVLQIQIAGTSQPAVLSGTPISSSGPVTTSGPGAAITSGTYGQAGLAAGGGVITTGSAVISGMPDQLPDRRAPQTKQKRKRVRDERQQMLNKLAQIRYRERKRDKTTTLTEQISALEAQLAELRVRQAENADLAQQNRALEAQIEAKDVSIAEVRGSGTSGPESPTSSGSPTASGAPERGGLPKDTPADLDQLVKDWLAKSREIMDLVALIGLGDGNKTTLGKLKNDVRRGARKTFSPKTRDVLKHVETRMNEMVSDVTSLCMRVMRLQGAQIQQLMTADYEMVCSMKGWKDEGKWLKAARELNFTPEQRTRLLAARDESLAILNQLYGERKVLNQQVLAGLQPGLFAAGVTDDTTTAAAREMVRLLDALGKNLAAEQQELARQDFVLFRQLLTPIQSGLLVALSFPDHCDALALMNAVAAVSDTVSPTAAA